MRNGFNFAEIRQKLNPFFVLDQRLDDTLNIGWKLALEQGLEALDAASMLKLSALLQIAYQLHLRLSAEVMFALEPGDELDEVTLFEGGVGRDEPRSEVGMLDASHEEEHHLSDAARSNDAPVDGSVIDNQRSELAEFYRPISLFFVF